MDSCICQYREQVSTAGYQKGRDHMKRSDIEQSIREIHYRLSKLQEAAEDLENQISGRIREWEDNENRKFAELDRHIKMNEQQICILEKRLSALSDELYAYIDRQDQKIIRHIDDSAGNLSERVQELSDRLYEHIGSQIQELSSHLYQQVSRQLSARDAKAKQERTEQEQKDWMLKFGYDSMIADLQLSQVETAVPGNRRRLLELKNTHPGEACFVIGNGPSLTAADLDRIRQQGIFCFASKGIYKIFPQTAWRPDVWGVSDLDYIGLKHKELDKLDGFVKLVCTQSYLKNGILIRDAVYYPFIQAERTPRCFYRDVLRGVHFYGTITGKLVNFAVYMGFTTIYLLGCDNTVAVKRDADGREVIDTSKELHFSRDYFDSEQERIKVYQNIDDLQHAVEYVNRSYDDLKWFCDDFGVKVLNATRGGELESFPRIDVEEILQKERKQKDEPV